jgi:hypothetical protein
MLSMKELKKPEVIGAIRFNRTKQKVAQKWEAMRKVNQVGYIDLEDESSIFACYQDVKSLLFLGFREDFPEEKRTPREMKIWLAQNAIAYGNMGDKWTRNIWVDLYECFMLLWELNKLPVEEGILT